MQLVTRSYFLLPGGAKSCAVPGATDVADSSMPWVQDHPDTGKSIGLAADAISLNVNSSACVAVACWWPCFVCCFGAGAVLQAW